MCSATPTPFTPGAWVVQMKIGMAIDKGKRKERKKKEQQQKEEEEKNNKEQVPEVPFMTQPTKKMFYPVVILKMKQAFVPDYHPQNYVPKQREDTPILMDNSVAPPTKTKEEEDQGEDKKEKNNQIEYLKDKDRRQEIRKDTDRLRTRSRLWWLFGQFIFRLYLLEKVTRKRRTVKQSSVINL